MLSHCCDTLPILFCCHFNLDGAGNGKMLIENLEKLLSGLHTYHTYLVHLEETEGFLIHEIKKESLRFLFFLFRGLDQMRVAC